MKKIVVGVLVLALLALIGWRVYSKLAKSEEPERRGGARAVAVAVAPVRRQTIRDVAEFTGTLLPNAQFVVAPKVSGRLEKLTVNIGDTVNNGDPIAVLDSEEYAQQVAQAQAELEVGRANLGECRSALDVAEREFKRAKDLREQKVAAESELDQAQARYEAAAAKFKVAEAQIQQKDAAKKAADVRLSYTRIQAMWSDEDKTQGGNENVPGKKARSSPRKVAERFVDEGAMLRANDPIVSVVDLSKVIAVVYVVERDFPDVKVEQCATITTDAYGEEPFAGEIVRIAPVLKEESRQARVEIEIPNSDGRLAPGMFVRAKVQFAEHKDATVVPVAALVRRDDRQGVFLADTKEMVGRFVPVKVGIVSGSFAEILEPPLEGSVVTLGHHLLEDGAAIAIPVTKGAAKGEEKSDRGPDRPGQKGRKEGR